MKALALALSLIAVAPAFASTITCSGESDGQAVQLVVAVDEAAGTASRVDVSVGDSYTASYSGEALQSETQNVPTKDGSVIPALILIGANESGAVVSIVASAEGQTAALAGIVGDGVEIDEVEMECSVAAE